MIYVTFAFVAFSILFMYRNWRHVSTRFFSGLILGWIISITSLLIYLSKFNYYYNIIAYTFNFPHSLWKFLLYWEINHDLIIRFLHFGILLFIYSLVCFSLLISRGQHARRYRLQVTALAIIPVMQLIYYDPSFQKWLQTLIFIHFHQNSFIKNVTTGIEFFFKTANIVYGLIAIILLAINYIKLPKIKILKNYMLFTISFLIPITMIHYITFSWAPQTLVRSTILHGYFNYIMPDVESLIKFYPYFPYIVLLSFSIIILLIFKYNALESYYKNQNQTIRKTMDTASMGIRAFTHSTKNHLLAIRSEAEYLLDKHRDDEDSAYSLKLILDSCSVNLENIDKAADKLRNIHLNMKSTLLSTPIRKALSRVPSNTNVEIDVQFCKEVPFIYADNEILSEALYNIIDNSLQAVREQELGFIRVIVDRRNQWGIISIQDSGPGIDQEDINQVFSPFFTTKSSIHNWGIGLSFTQKVIHAHDGKIVMNSDKGAGTKTEILLPIF